MINYLSKVLYVLGGEKAQLALLILVLTLSSFLEAIGIGLIGPFIRVASMPELINESSLLSFLYEVVSAKSEYDFIPALGLSIGIIFLLKSAIYFLSQSYIFHFTFRQKEKLISRLFNAYLLVPYSFYLKRNTASIIENIIFEVDQFTRGCLLQLLVAASSTIVITSLLLLLAQTDLSLLLLILTAVLPVFIFLKVFSKRFGKWGMARSHSNKEMIRILNHGLGSIKETRILGCESHFESQMNIQGRRFARASTLFSSSQLLPRILIETLLVLLIIGFISIYYLYSRQSLENLTAVLSVFAVAALRLIPAISQLSKAISGAQNTGYTLNLLYKDLREIEAGPVANSSIKSAIDSSELLSRQKTSTPTLSKFEHSIEISNIHYRYPGSDSDVIRDISLSIAKGESVAFVGKSGAGKTTLADIILGLLKPTDGDISMDGYSIYRNLRNWQNRIGYIPQSIFLIDDTIRNNIAFGVPEYLIDEQRVRDALEVSQLTALINELPNGLETGVGERGVRLSGGQRQRIGIARAIYHERDILVLDEASSALDGETEKQITDAIHALAGTKTLLIIAHRLSTIRKCDQVYMLEKGQVIKKGAYEEVFTCTS